jgi:hypothetical protein
MMTSVWRSLLGIGCLSLLLPFSGVAQDIEETGVQSSLGIRVGYGLPLGDWATSRVAPEVQLFTGSVAFEGDITIPLGQKWGLVLGGGYMPLNGSKWEEYAYSKGDAVSVSGSLAEVSISFRPYLAATPPNLVAFEFGAVGLFASGEETVNGEHYTYDFFSTFRFGLLGALEYDRIVSKGIALTLRAGVVVAPAGVNYADGESRTIIYMPLTAGIRFMF